VIKALIVDDEPIARQVLRQELEPLADIEVIGEADNGEEALRKIYTLAPELVFLDLEMPAMGGLEVVRNLRAESAPLIVILTAYDQHAIEAFEAGAIDYLLKPVGELRLRKAVERAISLQGKKEALAERAAKLAAVAGPAVYPTSRKIVGRSGQEYFLLDLDEILAFQAEGETVWIITARNRYQATQTLREIEARLKSSPFQRVHRSAIVNVNHVRKMSVMSSQRWLLTLTNSQELIVSKRQAHNVRHLLQW
jgi:two-component system LytT family response regulator